MGILLAGRSESDLSVPNEFASKYDIRTATLLKIIHPLTTT